ncbi:penicillin-binding protein, putative [Metarhizium acridum CQMa 102]|uniref:Penicillin-binding protein, putative n=1 Tax=Metarhizium acridum (strain CQMa 102) TaxID=655827 RepID=E9DZA4_METAQ|nr:penicillin-binding protein, putative [Metarhizium acridum CQMa 102]EFY91066.1 penicillin-binding protein, putative [Metarhizium acridum CQMa 102]
MKLVFIAQSIVALAASGQHPLGTTGAGHAVRKTPSTPDFANFTTDAMEEWRVPGVSIAVVDGDRVFSEGFGFATLPDIKATSDTLWSTGSTTKAFTAAALSLLVASKNYSELAQGWATPVSSIIRDDFVLFGAWATAHITLEDAVCHRTGIPRHDWSIPDSVNGRPATMRDLTRNLRHLRPSEEPRVKLQYSNYMFGVLSHVIEVLTGNGLERVLREYIWAPLGMNSTSFGAGKGRKTPERLSTGYYWHPRKQEFVPVSHEPLDLFSGTGAVVSSVTDYAEWLKCLLREADPFPSAVHRDIRRPRMIGTPEQNFGPDVTLYGLAWERTTLHGSVAYKHGGTTASGGAQVMWLPDLKYGIVVFANSGAASRSLNNILSLRLLEDRLDILPEDRYGAADKDVLYPERPATPLPPTAPQSQLIGKYYESGYGVMYLTEDTDSDKSSGTRTILVGRRPDRASLGQVRFEHVSGDYWIAHLWDPDVEDSPDYGGGHFKFDVGGRVAALEITISLPGQDINEGTITFERLG